MRAIRFRRDATATALLFLALAMAWAIERNALAHHTSAMPYVFQNLGRESVKGHSFDMKVQGPRPLQPGRDAKPLGHGTLDRFRKKFTHRFDVSIRHEKDLEPVPNLAVTTKIQQGGWTETTLLRPTYETGQLAYAANVRLPSRGPYDLLLKVSAGKGASREEREHFAKPVSLKFSFDYPYESVKEVMNALLETLAALVGESFTLGLDGEFIPPDKLESLNGKAGRMKRLAPSMAELRIGAAQELFEEKARALLEEIQEAEKAASEGKMDELAQSLVNVRSACMECHKIFQEADSTGERPKVPASLRRNPERK